MTDTDTDTNTTTKPGVLDLLRDIECMPEHPCDDARNAAALTVAKRKAGEASATVERLVKAVEDHLFYTDTRHEQTELRAALAAMKGGAA